MAKEEILDSILNDGSLKVKGKVEKIANLLLNGELSIRDVIYVAGSEKEVNKATLIESIEFASRMQPAIIDKAAFNFVIQNLKPGAARVQWESAKVIGNSAHLFVKSLKKAVVNLLINTESTRTVVRWSAAYALTQIIKCKTALNNELLPAIGSIIKREEDNAIKKIYLKALKDIS